MVKLKIYKTDFKISGNRTILIKNFLIKLLILLLLIIILKLKFFCTANSLYKLLKQNLVIFLVAPLAKTFYL